MYPRLAVVRSLVPATLFGVLTSVAVGQQASGATSRKTPANTARSTTLSPGLRDNHKLLQRAVGSFTAAFQVFHMPGKPTESKGTASGVSLFGGRHVRLQIQMPMMGRKMNHEVTLGYDTHKKTFDFTWLSDQSTGTTRATGTLKQVGKNRVVTFKGMMDDAMAGKRAVRHTFAFQADGTVEFTTFDTLPSGKELKIMVMTLTPRK